MALSQSQSLSSLSSIEQLVSTLRDQLDLTGEQIADVLWVTLELQKFEISSVNESSNLQDANSVLPKTTDQTPDKSQVTESITPTASTSKEEGNIRKASEKQGSVYANSGSGGIQGLSIGVPDAPSLREPLKLAQALRPLMRQVATGKRLILDEAATVQRIAEERIFMPVLKAEPELWLDLALVIDESHSMLIWGHTIQELKEIFKKYGIFRDIRIWGLQPDETGNSLQVFSRMGSSKRLTDPKEIVDPTGRRLILIVSDCVSNIWRKGMMFPVLKVWTEKQPLTILQMLPEWMWRRTALDLGTAVGFKSSIMGVANQQLSLHKPLRRSRSIGFKVEDRSKIPVITLDWDKAAQWSQMLIGKADALVPGYLLPPELEIEEDVSSSFLEKEDSTVSDLDAAEIVKRFRMTTSPLGRELAGLLAASPVINLPVVRLIQESLLPKSNQVQVAEVFLGGFLRPQSVSLEKLQSQESEIKTILNHDLVEYEFIQPEIRDIFLDDAPVNDSVDVVNAVSRYVAEQLGVSLSEFMAILKAPQTVKEKQREDTIKPFAEITARILRRLGEKYAAFAEQIEAVEVVNPINNQDLDVNTPKLTFPLEDALTFDGQDDYVSLGNPDILNFAGQITIEAWIKPQNITKTQNIVAHGYHRNPDAEVFLRIAEAEHEYQIGSWNGDDHRVGYPIPDEDIGTWVHLAGSYDGAVWKLYRNGIKVRESIEATGVLQVNANWAIAAAGNGTERFFHGQISEVRIWNKACSQQEIQENQFRQLKGNELGLVGYWPLDEGKGTTTQDRTSNGNLGQIAGVQWSKTTEQEIAALVELLQSTTVDDDTRRQAVESLGKIDPGNQIAIEALVELLQSTDLDNDIRRLVAESLKQINPGNDYFEVVTVDRRGEIIQKETKTAQYFTENLPNNVTLEMVSIPGGTFMMGSPPDEAERNDSETPQHEVTVPSFFMGKYPVTQAQWRVVATLPQIKRELKLDPSEFKGDDLPVEQISWYEAVEFCDRLSKQTNRDYRLATEAEWEYACRADTTTPFHFGETITSDLANYNVESTYADEPKSKYVGQTTPVGKFKFVNAFGLYDMHGNVWEWCYDSWFKNYKGAPNEGSAFVSAWINITAENDNHFRLLRGGCWRSAPRYCRSASRDLNAPDYRYGYFGCRVVVSAART